jgi:hypothetical protein
MVTGAGVCGDLLKFEITGEYTLMGKRPTSYSIVVAGGATPEQLTGLIYAIRDARRDDKLGALDPRWRGHEGVKMFEVLVFKNKTWADSDKLRKFQRMSLKSKEERAFSKRYAARVVAHYFLSPAEEEGSLGFDDGLDRSGVHKQLFYIKR